MFSLRALLQIFLPHLYTTFATTYDFFAALSSFGQWRTWQRIAMGPVAGRSRLLELGPGTGHVLLDLSREGHFSVGTDASTQMTRIAAGRLRGAGEVPRLVQARAQALPFAAGSFDAALSTFPTPYILDPDTHSEVRRVLGDDGRIVIILEAIITDHSSLDRFAAWLLRVTGASLEPSNRWLDPWRRAGFAAELQRVETRRAVVFRLVADKIEPAASEAPSEAYQIR
jgi:ubiquinone/menaquinone biosynthesis C-methylase UbiE